MGCIASTASGPYVIVDEADLASDKKEKVDGEWKFSRRVFKVLHGE